MVKNGVYQLGICPSPSMIKLAYYMPTIPNKYDVMFNFHIKSSLPVDRSMLSVYSNFDCPSLCTLRVFRGFAGSQLLTFLIWQEGGTVLVKTAETYTHIRDKQSYIPFSMEHL